MPLKGGLSSIDEYGKRIEIIPAEVSGFYRRWRDRTQWLLILFFLVMPWIQIQGQPFLLLDVIHSRYSFLGIPLQAHDSPLLFLIFFLIILGIALLTLVLGRVWCGWAYPQTVFIDAIYRRIERMIEGKYIQRRAFQNAPLSLTKFFKLSLKWILFTLVSVIISHSFLALFIGGTELLQMAQGSPKENWSYFLITSFATAFLLFNFAWFREQFCIAVCPYGRFQSVLSDSNSLTVLYDQKRGEPRKAKEVSKSTQGACVSCRRCVEVCPTGIDIRNGIQLECIGCTACVDACDEIMFKTKQPPGLIRYASLHEKAKIFRPRVVILAVMFCLVLARLFYSLMDRQEFTASIVRAKEMPYQVVKKELGDQVMNHFVLKIRNLASQDQTFDLQVADRFKEMNLSLVFPEASISAKAHNDKELHFFVLVPLEKFEKKSQVNIALKVHARESKITQEKELHLLGPEKL
jgi:cytochrome c oxidase accessory protein FixG